MFIKLKNRHKEKIELVSLIDMIFILLVFFLVTSFVIKMNLQERSLYVPTPKNVLGRAQYLIQFIDESRIFWLDEEASSVVANVEENYGYLSDVALRDRIISELISENRISIDQLGQKIDLLIRSANQDPFTNYFILIRCPNDLPYYHVIHVIEKLSNTQYRNIKYGAVGGTFDDIRFCKRIYNVVEKDSKGRRRKNLRIDF
jgi:biopolymer transport protein ExbD